MLLQSYFGKGWDGRCPQCSPDSSKAGREGKGSCGCPLDHKTAEKILTTALGPPPYAPSPMQFWSGNKLYLPHEERSPSGKICPQREYQMGKGDPCRVMFLFHAKHHSMRCLGKWVSYSENPPNLGEFGCLKPLLGGMRWSSSIGIARIKKKL